MALAKQKLVLVADDDPYIAAVFQRAFSGQEDIALLDIAMTVELALKKIAVVFYDLVFLDMKFGHSMAGMVVLEELRRQEIKLQNQGIPFLETKVVIMTGSVSLNDLSQQAHGLRVFHFIDKPLPMNEDFVRLVANQFGIPILPRVRQDGRDNFQNPTS